MNRKEMMSKEYAIRKMVETYWELKRELSSDEIEDLKYLKSQTNDEELLFKIIMMI